MIKNKLFKLSAITLALMSSSVTFAQENNSSPTEKQEKKQSSSNKEMEVIFVTSDKMGSASQQEMATTVKLLSSEDLLERGIYEFVDFAGSIPSLQFQDLGPGDKEYIIRGVNSSGPSTVGVYFDETPITGSNAQDGGGRNVDIKMVDLESAEVFNGPQGTQYGANSMSGLIRYVPNKPDTNEFTSFVDVDFSTTEGGGNNTMLSGVLNIPLIDDELAIRLVAWNANNDGWIDQPRHIGGAKENVNDEKNTGGRIMVRYAPTDEAIIDMYYLSQSMEIGGSSRYVPKNNTYFGLEDSDYPVGTSDNDYTNYDLGTSPWDEQLDLFNITLNYEFELGTLTATTNTYKRDIEFNFDFTPLVFGFGINFPSTLVQPQEREVSFTEIRFASDLDDEIQFFVGASYRKEHNDWETYGVAYDEHGNATEFKQGEENLWSNGGNVIYQRYFHFELEQSAVFGEMSYEANDSLILTAGGRYFKSDQHSTEGSRFPEDSDPSYNNADGDKFTGKLSAAYQYDTDINYYATISQGFRVGGLNNSDSVGNGIPKSYESDFLTNYEAGFKTQFDDQNITFNATVYYIDWEDIQVETTSGAVPYITNAGSAAIQGLEVTFSSYIGKHFLFEFSGSYADSYLTEDQPAVEDGGDQGKDGDKIPNVPATQGYLAISYIDEISWGDLTVRLDITHRGSADIMFDNTNEFNYNLAASNILSFRSILEMSNGLHATFYIRNLTNEIAEYDAINSPQDPLAVIGAKPRTVGLRLRQSF